MRAARSKALAPNWPTFAPPQWPNFTPPLTAQADLLIEVLSEERPAELADAYEDAMGRGPAWRNRILASLSLMPQARKRIDDIN
jgi:hypothetical protein